MSLKVAIHDHECFPNDLKSCFIIFVLFHFKPDDIFKVPNSPLEV